MFKVFTGRLFVLWDMFGFKPTDACACHRFHLALMHAQVDREGLLACAC